MFSKTELYLALKFMRSKRKDSFISLMSIFSMIGIIIGVATLIVVMSVMNGFHKEFLHNILGIQGHITVLNHDGKFSDYNNTAEQISKIDGVKFVAPLIIGQGMALNSQHSAGVVVRGIDANLLFKKPAVQEALSGDAEKQFRNNDGVLIGSALAMQLRLHRGDEIKLISASGNTSIVGFIPRIKTYKVAGIFDLGLYQYNITTIFMPLEDAQLFFQHTNSVTEIEVITRDPENLSAIKSAIAKNINDDISIIDWRDNQSAFLNSLAVERVVMFIILTLIIVVAAFNIISSMIMLVKDKSRNIAVLRTLGATRNSILRIFIISGSLIGIIGTIIGAALGVLFALNIGTLKTYLESLTGMTLFDPVIYFLTRLPADLEISSVLAISAMSIILSVLATLYPAIRAAKLSPAQVLRYE